jgi:putative restriction endonuclease
MHSVWLGRNGSQSSLEAAHLAMPLPDIDAELRLAALAALRELVAPTGGVIDRTQLAHGFEFHGQRIPFANQAVGIWTPGILSRAGGAALSITTTAPKVGRPAPYEDHEHDDGSFTYHYQGNNDPDNHYNRALRRAAHDGAPLIYFVGLAPGVYEAIYPVYIEDHRDEHVVTVTADAVGLGESTLLHGGSAPLLKEYATRQVKVRLHQSRFRELVVGAYGRRCTVCRLGARDRLVRMIDAAHIVPDRDPKGMPEVPNGLALCKIHHAAFDLNILGIDADLIVHVRTDILSQRDGPMLQHGIKEMDRARIVVPHAAKLHPRRDYLRARFEQFQAA